MLRTCEDHKRCATTRRKAPVCGTSTPRPGGFENRRSADVQAAIIASVQARIPMVTAEERCAHEVVLAERERAVWDGMRDLLEERAAGQAELASEASAASGAARGLQRMRLRAD